MNKQELIEQIKCLKNIFGNKTKYVEKDTVIKLISELDEPEKILVSEEEAKFLIGYCLLTTCLLFMQQKPLLVYHADSKYAITGKVTEKRKIGKLFTITINGNVFVVSEERYKIIDVGDEVEI